MQLFRDIGFTMHTLNPGVAFLTLLSGATYWRGNAQWTRAWVTLVPDTENLWQHDRLDLRLRLKAGSDFSCRLTTHEPSVPGEHAGGLRISPQQSCTYIPMSACGV